MKEFITIAKKPGVKNCIRINTEKDIPDFLKEVIKIEGKEIILDCLEGEEKAPQGSVIAFEKLENGKMNVWNKANWATTTFEKDGIFYELPKPNKALQVTEELPLEIINGFNGKMKILEDGTYVLDAGWGLVSCSPNNGYLVIYGKKEDGSLDANFLTKGTPSFEQYYVLDEEGNILKSLPEYDEELMSNKNSTL